jgi:hypothetical protein
VIKAKLINIAKQHRFADMADLNQSIVRLNNTIFARSKTSKYKKKPVREFLLVRYDHQKGLSHLGLRDEFSESAGSIAQRMHIMYVVDE